MFCVFDSQGTDTVCGYIVRKEGVQASDTDQIVFVWNMSLGKEHTSKTAILLAQLKL